MTTKSADLDAPSSISVERVQRRTLLVPVVGTAPLITHRWSEKAKAMMLAAQQGGRKQKTIRNPQEEFESSMYRLPDGSHGFPALGFKNAVVGGARFFGKDVSMVTLRRVLFFGGEGPDMLTKLIEHDDPVMREDMVRIGQGTAELRYRAQYTNWRAALAVQYVPHVLNLSSLLALIDAGGSGDGVGEWRPERKGIYGTFQVDDKGDIVEIDQ